MNKILKLIILITILILPSNIMAEYEEFEWMSKELFGSDKPDDIEVPQFSNINESSTALNLANADSWVATGVHVQKDKFLQLQWDTSGVQPAPDKYLVLYRIDPRFPRPQVFIQKYDYEQQKYVSDFHSFNNGTLSDYQDLQDHLQFFQMKEPVDYFNFAGGRNKIPVKAGDVINITLDDNGDFFGANTEMTGNLGTGHAPTMIYTESSSLTNEIMYTTADNWCTHIFDTMFPGFPFNLGDIVNSNCNIAPTGGHFITQSITGNFIEGPFVISMAAAPTCSEGLDGMNNPACTYDKGRGMTIKVGNTTIKDTKTSFIRSPFTNKDFFYYFAQADGDLDFTTDWQITGMYNNIDQLIGNWSSIPGVTDYPTLLFYMATSNMTTNFIHVGRYFMIVEIGNANATISPEDLESIGIEYAIAESGEPGADGNPIDMSYKGDAYQDGYLWLKVTNPNELSGVVTVKITNYVGSTWFSTVIYDYLVKPLREMINELVFIFYSKLITNVTLQNIVRTMLVLYIMIYGLAFLAGSVRISTTDIVVRVIKIAVVLILFSENSWQFFNDNLFGVFVNGVDYLISSVIGVTGQTGNIFGFIDPIFSRYTNPNVWILLLIQFIQIHTGLTFFALMVMYSMIIYLRAVLEVIVNYCLAFLGIAVMISLAPFFITFILFEKTKSLFDNWISTLFSYMIQPTILMVFFLIIDQFMSGQITKAVISASWQDVIPLTIEIDLHHMSMPLEFSFSLPFLKSINFYVSAVTAV
ncbi:MAG: type IV secretion system protein [Rickettsiaceae bacterium]|nr:type IV secretion system protein [Rickettsiaceae bacterium]